MSTYLWSYFAGASREICAHMMLEEAGAFVSLRVFVCACVCMCVCVCACVSECHWVLTNPSRCANMLTAVKLHIYTYARIFTRFCTDSVQRTFCTFGFVKKAFFDFLDASSHLYNRVCPSVRRLVGQAFVKNKEIQYFWANSWQRK